MLLFCVYYVTVLHRVRPACITFFAGSCFRQGVPGFAPEFVLRCVLRFVIPKRVMDRRVKTVLLHSWKVATLCCAFESATAVRGE